MPTSGRSRLRREASPGGVVSPSAVNAAGGKPKVVAIGVAQEFQRVFTGYERPTRPGVAQFGFAKADRRVSVYYFYLWDSEFGPGFVKVATYFPYPMKVWVNGHEWA